MTMVVVYMAIYFHRLLHNGPLGKSPLIGNYVCNARRSWGDFKRHSKGIFYINRHIVVHLWGPWNNKIFDNLMAPSYFFSSQLFTIYWTDIWSSNQYWLQLIERTFKIDVEETPRKAIIINQAAMQIDQLSCTLILMICPPALLFINMVLMCNNRQLYDNFISKVAQFYLLWPIHSSGAVVVHLSRDGHANEASGQSRHHRPRHNNRIEVFCAQYKTPFCMVIHALFGMSI